MDDRTPPDHIRLLAVVPISPRWAFCAVPIRLA